MTPSPDRIEVDYRFSDLPLEEILRHLWQRNRKGWRHRVVSALGWILLAAAAVSLIRMLQTQRTSGPELVVVDLAVGMLATLFALWFQNATTSRRMLSAMREAPFRRSGMRVILDPQGVTILGTGARVVQSWRSIVAVEDAAQTTLLFPSESEFYPIPHHALPEDVSPDLLRSRIVAWRHAAERIPWPDPPPFSSTVMGSLSTPKVPPSLS